MNDNLLTGIAIGGVLVWLWLRRKGGCAGSSTYSSTSGSGQVDAAGYPVGVDRNGNQTQVSCGG